MWLSVDARLLKKMNSTEKLVAPFPYFGGKKRAVDLVWPRFGEVKNYIEPFCGSLAMLLGAPEGKRVETVNDANGFIVNFWRAIQADPEAVAYWADWPVSEIDLEARHGWLVNRTERLRWSLQDPDFYDAKIAGWWVWGASSWLGCKWCLGDGSWTFNGVEFSHKRKLVKGSDWIGVERQRPHLGHGSGINRVTRRQRFRFILDWFDALSVRLRDVRIVCGDWSRVVAPILINQSGPTAIFFDPPYDAPGIKKGLYFQTSSISTAVGKWCLDNGENPHLRIILCGYAGEHNLPGWTVVRGRGMAGGFDRKKNYRRERMWISPHCLNPRN